MRVAILHRFPLEQIGETNASIHFLIETIRGAGHKVDIKTFKKFNRLSPLIKLLKSILWIFYAPFTVILKGYDIIYIDDSFPYAPYLVKLVCPKSKVVIRLGDLHLMYYCSGKVYNFFHWFERKTWKKVDMILAISETMAEHLRIQTGKEIWTVLDPVNLDDFKVKWSPLPQKTVMFHGTITKNKGLDRLIFAAMALPEIKFVIIGEGEDMSRLQGIAPDNVIFQGHIPYKEIPFHLATANIGVAMRSRNRGNDYVVTSPFLQYSAIGVPCLVSRRQVFRDMKYLDQFNTTEELIELIKLRIKTPRSWKYYVKQNHDAEKIARQIWFLLSSLVKKFQKN